MTASELEAKIKKSKAYLKSYRAGNESMTTSNIRIGQLKRNIKRLEDKLASEGSSVMLPAIKVTAKRMKQSKKAAPVVAKKESKSGNIGRTTTKYDTPKGKARVEKLPAAVKKKKKKSGPSFGKDYDSYMNSYFNRRK